MLKKDYLESFWGDNPGFKDVYRKFIESLLTVGKGEEKKLKLSLDKLYIAFYGVLEQKPPDGDEGFSRFIFKTLIKLGLRSRHPVSHNIDIIVKDSFGRKGFTQKEFIDLFNEYFSGLIFMNESHFSAIKKDLIFTKQKELPWLIYLNFMRVISSLAKALKNRTSFSDLRTVVQEIIITEIPNRERQKVEVSCCMEFIRYVVFPGTGRVERDKELLVQKMFSPLPGKTEKNKDRKDVPVKEKANGKFIVILFSVFVFLSSAVVLARLGLLGDQLYGVSKNYFSFNIPDVDTFSYLDFACTFHRINEYGAEELFNDGVCYSGDQIEVEFLVPEKSYAALFCVDSRGIQPLGFNGPQADPEPLYFDRETKKKFFFTLDDSTGLEVYYFLVSRKSFTFEGDVKRAVNQLFPGGSIKGPLPGEYELELKRAVRQSILYLNHLEKYKSRETL